jgi:hypothetical protein
VSAPGFGIVAALPQVGSSTSRLDSTRPRRSVSGVAVQVTENPYRGDHMSIPCYTEDGDVFVLDISFHKGDTFIERVGFPDGPLPVRKALYDLLDSCETR